MSDTSTSDPLSLLACRIQETQDTRASHLREVEKLDALLARMQIDFNELTNRAALVASIPNEILGAIFEAGTYLLPRSYPDLQFEILVSQVTRHWRNVAMSTPSLWSQIVMIKEPYNLEMVEAYLTRSGSLPPLDIWLKLTVGSPPTDSILRSIIPHVGRWRRVWLHCIRPRRHLLSMFRSSTFPLLESIQIIFDDDQTEELDDYYEGAPGDTNRMLNDGAPLLKTVQIKGMSLHRCMLPLSAVTTLHIHRALSRPTLVTMLAIFGNLRSLAHLVLYGRVVRDPGLISSSTSTILFPVLSSLHIISSSNQLACLPMLGIISAPLLECLSLEDASDEDIKTLMQTTRWSTNPPRYPSLSSLTLSFIVHLQPCTWRLIEQSFTTVTHLAVLDIMATELSNVLLQTVGVDSNSSLHTDIPWPRLQMLSLGEEI